VPIAATTGSKCERAGSVGLVTNGRVNRDGSVQWEHSGRTVAYLFGADHFWDSFGSCQQLMADFGPRSRAIRALWTSYGPEVFVIGCTTSTLGERIVFPEIPCSYNTDNLSITESV